MRKAIYEVETDRTNMTPKQFYSHCKRTFEKKTGMSWYWTDDFSSWFEPVQVNDIWAGSYEAGTLEVCITKPAEWHLFYQGTYNFIMEWKDGCGYMYAVEWEQG